MGLAHQHTVVSLLNLLKRPLIVISRWQNPLSVGWNLSLSAGLGGRDARSNRNITTIEDLHRACEWVRLKGYIVASAKFQHVSILARNDHISRVTRRALERTRG